MSRLKLTKKLVIEEPEGGFYSCHHFTYTVIDALVNSQEGIVNKYFADWNDMVRDLKKAQCKEFETTLYNQILNKINTSEIEICSLQKIMPLSLLIFLDCGIENGTRSAEEIKKCGIAHSMLAISPDEWIGSRNLSSLGYVSGDYIISRENAMVMKYSEMYQREYRKKEQGGWNNDGRFINKDEEEKSKTIILAIPILNHNNYSNEIHIVQRQTKQKESNDKPQADDILIAPINQGCCRI